MYLVALAFLDTGIGFALESEDNHRTFSREFQLEAVKLVRYRGASVAQAARDLYIQENLLKDRLCT